MKMISEVDGYLIKFTPTEFYKVNRGLQCLKDKKEVGYNLRDVERITILDALKFTSNHMGKASKLLGFNIPASLRLRLKQYREQGYTIPVIKAGRKKRS